MKSGTYTSGRHTGKIQQRIDCSCGSAPHIAERGGCMYLYFAPRNPDWPQHSRMLWINSRASLQRAAIFLANTGVSPQNIIMQQQNTNVLPENKATMQANTGALPKNNRKPHQHTHF